jgi:hypothetical protein
MMKKILLLMVCGLFACTLNAQTATNESPYGESVNSNVNVTVQNVITLSVSDRVIIANEDFISFVSVSSSLAIVSSAIFGNNSLVGTAISGVTVASMRIGLGAPPSPSDFSAWKTHVSGNTYYGYAEPNSGVNIDRYEWWTEPGTGWIITDRNLGAPMQYVQITNPSSSASSILRARAHNSDGWGDYKIVSYVGP